MKNFKFLTQIKEYSKFFLLIDGKKVEETDFTKNSKKLLKGIKQKLFNKFLDIFKIIVF